MKCLNKVSLIGRVGRDPEFHTCANGKDLAYFSFVTSELKKNPNTSEKNEQAEWHQIKTFNPHHVDFLKKYIRKGAALYIEGQLRYEPYTDREGVKRTKTVILLDGFGSQLLALSTQNQSNQNHGVSSNEDDIPDDFDDEIPF